MVSELLVPVGVLLHWTKFFDVKGKAPLIISFLGFFVIVGIRFPILLRLLYLFFSNISHPFFSQIYLFVHGFFFAGILTALYLDMVWGKLYYTNILRLIQESKTN